MSEQPIEIPITLDAQGFTAGAAQLSSASDNLQQSMRGLTVSTAGVQKLWDVVTPNRAAIAGMGAFAGMAALSQQRLSGLRATATTTKVDVDKLGGSIRQMSRDMPMGAKQTTAVVEQFTRMGVAAKGSERQIAALSKSVIQLGGATGDDVGQLADGMTNLARATGNTNLDPKRFTALSDSLTKVSASSGASATSVLSFSRNIAPMANAAGIGSVGILGISSAFARLGEDGLGASTAVNKMLTDMSRSVREGGPQMRSYAEIVGKTTGEFERLFKANPTEALTQVTEAIAKAGPGGTRMLEQLGAGSVREQRALTALSASGGLRPAIASATQGYGSGATEVAAAAAFHGLNDSLVELRETSTQLAEAMGTPLLGPLTMFADALKVPLELLGSIAGSGVGQGAMTAAAYTAGPALLMKSLLGPLTMLGMGRQGLTSTPLRAAAAGYAEGRNLPPSSFLSRFGSPIVNAAQEGVMGEYAARTMNIGRDIGEGMGSVPGGVQGRRRTRPGFRELAFGAGGSAAQLSFNMATESLMNATTTDPTRRTPVGFNAGPAFEGGWKEFKDSFKPGGGGIGSAMTNFRDRTAEAGKGVSAMTGAAKAYAKVPVAAAQVGGALAKDAGKGIAGLAGLAGAALGPGALVVGGATAAIAGVGLARANKRAQQQEIEDRGQMDIRSSINSYRESIGLATSQTVTLANSMSGLSKNVALTTDTFAAARKVTAREAEIAGGNKDEVLTHFTGTGRQQAAQISLLSTAGLTPQELAAVGQDLVKSGKTAKQATAILSQVDVAGSTKGANIDALMAATTGAAGSERGGIAGWYSRNVQTGGRGSSFLDRPGGFLHVGGLGDAGKEQVGVIASAIEQQKGAQIERYGVGYARQTEAQSMNKVMDKALKSGNDDLVFQLKETFKSQLGLKDVDVSSGAIAQKGFVQALMDASPEARRKFKGTELIPGQGLTAEDRQGAISKRLERGGFEDFAAMYDFRTKTPVSGAVEASLLKPEDMKKFSVAVEGMTAAAHKGGKSFENLAFEAAAAVRGTDTGTPQYAQMMAVASKAQQGVAAEQITMSPAQRMAQNLRMAQREIAVVPTDKEGIQRREEAIAQAQSTKDAMQQQVTARATQVRAYTLQYNRAFKDFDRAQEYAEEDYLRSRQRAQRNFGIQIDRLREDAAKQMYNPYDRIMTAPTWDTQNLLVNAKEQTEALEKQSKQLRQLRRAGVSQQSIDTLELYKPENAQQLNTMADDLINDPKLRQRFNKTFAARGAAAGAMATDPSNTDVRRMRQDFQRGLGDMAKDMDRARERNQQAFNRGIHRMEVDMRRANQTIAGDAADLGKKIDKGLAHQAVHWTSVMVDETQVILDEFKNKVVPEVEDAIAGVGLGSQQGAGAEYFMPSNAGMQTQSYNAGPVTRTNGQVLGTNGSSTPVTHTGGTTIDQRNDFTGSTIHVQTNDPDDLANKAAARARTQNLTRTRGVPHGAVT